MSPRKNFNTPLFGKRRKRTWADKFRDAFLGLKQAIHKQSSFYAHFFVAICVLFLSWWLDFDAVRLSIIILCIGFVITAEMFNTALESLAKAFTMRHDDRIGKALNVASAAVLTAAFTAACVGTFVFFEAILTQ